jgi:hypothetical protein
MMSFLAYAFDRDLPEVDPSVRTTNRGREERALLGQQYQKLLEGCFATAHVLVPLDRGSDITHRIKGI